MNNIFGIGDYVFNKRTKIIRRVRDITYRGLCYGDKKLNTSHEHMFLKPLEQLDENYTQVPNNQYFLKQRLIADKDAIGQEIKTGYKIRNINGYNDDMIVSNINNKSVYTKCGKRFLKHLVFVTG